MSRILDRYASAISSSNLASDPRTTYSDSDVLGAAGLAGKTEPLAMMLERMFLGDRQAGGQAAQYLAQMAIGFAERRRLTVRRIECADIARAVVAWHRDGVCKACGGHGYSIIPGTRTIGEEACKACRGTGRVLLGQQFDTADQRDLALWLLAHLQAESSKAGPAAMAKLAERLPL
jgi:hypothetical protein